MLPTLVILNFHLFQSPGTSTRECTAPCCLVKSLANSKGTKTFLESVFSFSFGVQKFYYFFVTELRPFFLRKIYSLHMINGATSKVHVLKNHRRYPLSYFQPSWILIQRLLSEPLQSRWLYKEGKQWRLAGSARRACDSWSQSHEFEPHAGCKDYLEK